jgi:hypothetical protein
MAHLNTFAFGAVKPHSSSLKDGSLKIPLGLYGYVPRWRLRDVRDTEMKELLDTRRKVKMSDHNRLRRITLNDCD